MEEIIIKNFKTATHHYFNAVNKDGYKVGGVGILFGDKLHEIVYVHVIESYRHKGIATRLLKEALKEYEQCDITLLVCPTDTSNTIKSLVSFYSQFGFEVRKDYTISVKMLKKKENKIL